MSTTDAGARHGWRVPLFTLCWTGGWLLAGWLSTMGGR